ncbi:MAG: hypothetical protein ACFBWO_15540 [Paracoccaceae bacterium]
MRRLALAALLAPALALAHHGHIEYAEEITVLEGFVSKPMRPFPHWEMSIRVDGEDWVIDLGNSYEMRNAGLREDGSDFTVGQPITVEGHRAADEDWRRILPEVIEANGERYEFDIDIYD